MGVSNERSGQKSFHTITEGEKNVESHTLVGFNFRLRRETQREKKKREKGPANELEL